MVLLPDEDEEKLLLHRVVDGDRRGEQLYVCIDDLREPIPERTLRPNPQHGVQPWVQVNLLEELSELAEASWPIAGGLRQTLCHRQSAGCSVAGGGTRCWDLPSSVAKRLS